MALSHSVGGFGEPRPISARIAPTHEPMSPTTGASMRTLLSASMRRNVDLDEALAAPRFEWGPPHVLPLPCDSSQFEARADQHHDVGFRQHVRARGGCGLLVRVGQQALGHRHGQVRDAGLFHQRANVRVGLRVRRALAENDQRTLRRS